MDILDELELMAQAASDLQENDKDMESTIPRWQKLFGYSASTAEFKIKEHRKYMLNFIISDDHWFVVRERMEAEGHDRESYEHFNQRTMHDIIDNQNITMEERRMLRALSFLIKLEGPFDTVKSIIEAAGLSPDVSNEVLPATDFFGEPCSFYRINAMDKMAIEDWLWKHPQLDLFSPTYVRDIARKDLSSTSLYPTLGIDTTMPQYRPESDKSHRLTPRPSQNEYPVWYFLYGTLLDKVILAKLFGSDFHAPYRVAKIRGGTVKKMGRYNALVDDESGTNVVYGKAMRVQTREHEERLRAYETNVYEVVRCKIEVGPEEYINGLTFRFIAEFME
ncbi:hypothetical protein NW768_012057 [Fusarium equiseti]|uniref:Gamma-glutamylcyclotransferase AIG2-like domain-containing protein n=1 Tax=Fusarium equiseti TaxID=61235 RepID=A0ABQ8QVZ9_FUSEQ|nr:hypothetical protein NW768_012057 [Fusarium equiseti]